MKYDYFVSFETALEKRRTLGRVVVENVPYKLKNAESFKKIELKITEIIEFTGNIEVKNVCVLNYKLLKRRWF